jgi:nanoRNase/pAp phosphatase (c-di-AMP/oligoRNAs hydrolase)
MNQFTALLRLLEPNRVLYIQTHDYPDYDSIASAFGLQWLLNHFGITSRIIYEGDIHRDSLQSMIAELNIEIRHNEEYNIQSCDRSVVVDGCVGNQNVTGLVAREIGVIDHHEVEHPENVEFIDIRPTYGSCATVIYSYFKQNQLSVPPAVATALLIGITMDTAHLTRGVCSADLDAHRDLYPLANRHLVNEVVTNYIQPRDLGYYQQSIENLLIRHRFAFCYFPHGCSKNLLGILADFLMGIRDADVVALCARNIDEINFSIRCKRDDGDASRLIRSVLADCGFGGGHRHMAGGSIRQLDCFDVDIIYNRFCTQLHIPLVPEGTVAANSPPPHAIARLV